jgi:ATP-dependent RNA helicase DeaD
MINRLIEADQIEGFEAAAPRAKGPARDVKVIFTGLDSVKPPPKPDGEEDDGWGSDAPPAAPPDTPPSESGEPAKKPVFGRRNKRYSQRL